MYTPPESPIASKARSPKSCKSPRATLRRLGSAKRTLNATYSTSNSLEKQDAENDATLFSPAYNERGNFNADEKYELNFDDDMVAYHHVRLLQSFTRKAYIGPQKLPMLEETDKYTLVLDLDETLVHCSTEPVLNPDVNFNLQFNGISFNVSAKFRPHLQEFLEALSEHYEIVIFTASQKVYADKVIDYFDVNHRIKYRLYREDCTNVCGNFVKDLSVLGRDLKKTIFIDNSPQAFTYQINNSIPIVSWYSDEADIELEKMVRILKEIRTYQDVREYISEAFGIEDLIRNLPETANCF